MTVAPDDLRAVQRYAHEKTGQPLDALGIIHSAPQGGGYHEGEDLLAAAGRAPGPQFPDTDYSYNDARDRDLAPNGRLAGGDNASAFDFGDGFPQALGGFDGFLKFNAWMRERMLANDPRTRDIREMIHTLNGTTVRRLDRTGRQPDSGDLNHLTHTHFSFFRDSLGRRDRDDNFLGLLREFFEGAKMATVPGTGNRDDLTVLSDLWNGEQNISSGFGPGQTKRQAQLNRIEAHIEAVAKGASLSDADRKAIVDEVSTRIEAKLNEVLARLP